MLGDSDTRDRLLKGAREVFAQRGLQGATVRDICSRASVNVAAVSYHFGGKEKLYAAVLRDYIAQETRRYPRDQDVTPASSPEERLRAYIRSLLRSTLGEGEPEEERLGKLLLHEIMEPSPHFYAIFDEAYRPAFALLLDIVRQLLPDAGETAVTQCASSINGQCVLYRFARASIARVTPELALTADNVECVTEFIMQFSLGGVARMAEARQN
jgi:TetR/AcrR family transcriptional regulator, regulator of cefoperazone and chloramphenicol sensitivity